MKDLQELTITVEPKKARVYKKIADMQGSERLLRIINIVFAFCLAAACLAWAIYRVATLGFSDPNFRYLASLAIGAVGLFPLLLERIFKFNLSGFLMLLFLAFLTMAGFIGSGLGMYSVWSGWHYDKVTHGVFGYIGAVAGLFIIIKLGDPCKNKLPLVLIVCFAVSLACGAVWEIYEFTYDRLSGAIAQGVRVFDGYATVLDTMLDIIANFIGALVFLLHYILHVVTKKNLLMGSMIKDFCR